MQTGLVLAAFFFFSFICFGRTGVGVGVLTKNCPFAPLTGARTEGRARASQPKGDQHLQRLIKANRDAFEKKKVSAALQRSIFPLCPAVPFPRDAQAFFSGHSDFPSPSAAGLSPHGCPRGSCERHFQHMFICDAQVLSN